MSSRQKDLIFFILIFSALLAIQVCPAGFFDPDGYYHTQMARLLSSGNFLTRFPWLSAATWAKNFADQHFLYHILLIPFVKISPIAGAQIFNALTGAVFAAIFHSLLKSQKISYPKLWTLFCLFASSGFLFRLSLVKATGLSLCLMFLFIKFLQDRKPKKLFIIAFIFVWTYGGFVFLPVILALQAAAWLGSGWLAEKKLIPAVIQTAIKNGLWKIFVYPAFGIILGLLLFPHAPDLLRQLYNQIFQAGLAYKISVGREWNRSSLQDLLSGNGFVFFAWIFASAWIFAKARQQLKNSRLLFLFFLALFFLALSVKSKRFIEEAVPFMVLFSACALQPFLLSYPWPKIKTKFRQNFSFGFPLVMGALCILIITLAKTQAVAQNLHKPMPISHFQGVSQYLLASSSPGEIVFNTTWDTFPQLFFLNPQNYYVTGMDPMFMYIADAQKYWLWKHISDGQNTSCPIPACRP